MNIAAFIAKTCVQTAVYWGNPQVDGNHDVTYDDPVEIECRWEDRDQVILDNHGEEILSRAVVFVTQQLDYNGRLFLGTLADLDSDQESDPASVEEAHIIKRFEKVPGVSSTTVFLYCAYLTPWLA